MRVLAILLGLLWASLLGCEDRYGTYITIRASNKDQRFDHLDLYFGVAGGKAVPTTPRHQAPLADAVTQLVVHRSAAPSDSRDFAKPVHEYTVWIPDGGENDNLGDYLLAIASAGGQRIGAAELFDFHVTTEREVAIYEMALEDVNDSELEEWGRPADGRAENDCLRFEHSRGADRPGVVAIVREDDTDCDAFLDRSDTGATDCEPLLYCDGTGGGDCIGHTQCIHNAGTCSVGQCANADGLSTTCENDTCVANILCSECDLGQTPADIVQCALTSTSSHPSTDMPIPVKGNGALCNEPTRIDITLPFACTAPDVIAIAYVNAGSLFEFRIDPGAMQNVCKLTITPMTPNERFTGIPHLLVSVETTPPLRTGFVLGLKESSGGCPGPTEAVVRQYAPNVGACPIDQ